jgi:hypothetical protein
MRSVTMSPAHRLSLTSYAAVVVLVPDERGGASEGIKITVFGEWFPVRALEPKILVGDQVASRVQIAPNQRSIRGFLADTPPEGAVIRVRYGPSQEGELEERFTHVRIRPVPEDCLPAESPTDRA